MMKIKYYKWLCLILAILLVVVLVAADEHEENEDGGYEGYGPMVHDWYLVSDQEIKFCNSWGGHDVPSSSESVNEANLPQVVKTTMTLQGLVSDVGETSLYEVAWYLHPLSGDVAYTVFVKNEAGQKIEIDQASNGIIPSRGNANAIDADAYYDAFESEVKYTHLILEAEGEAPFEVPFVEKEGY